MLPARSKSRLIRPEIALSYFAHCYIRRSDALRARCSVNPLGDPDPSQLAARTHDLAMFRLAIDSKLRACDLIRLRVCDICPGQRVASRATQSVAMRTWHARVRLPHGRARLAGAPPRTIMPPSFAQLCGAKIRRMSQVSLSDAFRT